MIRSLAPKWRSSGWRWLARAIVEPRIHQRKSFEFFRVRIKTWFIGKKKKKYLCTISRLAKTINWKMWIHNQGWIQLALSEKSRERGRKFRSHLISRDSDGRKRKRWETGRNVVFIADLQSSRSARTPKRKSAKKVESSLNFLLHNSIEFELSSALLSQV